MAAIAAGQLKPLDIAEHRGRKFSFPIHVMHKRGSPPGRAGRWLIAELRRQLPIICPLAGRAHPSPPGFPPRP